MRKESAGWCTLWCCQFIGFYVLGLIPVQATSPQDFFMWGLNIIK